LIKNLLEVVSYSPIGNVPYTGKIHKDVDREDRQERRYLLKPQDLALGDKPPTHPMATWFDPKLQVQLSK